jgi:excisionase family DNA binding protein
MAKDLMYCYSVQAMRDANHQPEDFLTVDEAAQLAGYSHWTIRRWVDVGKLTRYRIGARVVVSRAELLELVKPRIVTKTKKL